MEGVKHLPCDIISDILSRLPIESLMLCKSVCKSWFSLIEDHSFVELQLKGSKSLPPRLILGECYGADRLLLLDRHRERNDMLKARDINLEYMWNYREEEEKLIFDIVGSCNGLLCMVSLFRYGCCRQLYGIFICNPITRECVMLPVGNGRYYNQGQIGFGKDSTGKYKVIQIFKKRDPSTIYDHLLKGEIITLGESSWREIDIPYQSDYNQCGYKQIPGMVFINGVLYCIIRKPTTLWQLIILVFDLYDQKFYTIELPPSVELVSGSWSCQCVDSHLLVYNLEKKEYMRLGVSGTVPNWFHGNTFVPSRVSPIAIAFGKTKKDTRSRFQGLHLEVMGYIPSGS